MLLNIISKYLIILSIEIKVDIVVYRHSSLLLLHYLLYDKYI